jgi:hypothetical protein
MEPVAHLADHPNLAEILAIRRVLLELTEAQMTTLAAQRQPTETGSARAAALGPDTPLLFDVLEAFSVIDDLVASARRGYGPGGPLPAEVFDSAFKAARDAVAAAYARPVLDRRHYEILIKPWRIAVG